MSVPEQTSHQMDIAMRKLLTPCIKHMQAQDVEQKWPQQLHNGTHLLSGSRTCTCMTELMHFRRYSGLLYVMMTTAAITPCVSGAGPMQAGPPLLTWPFTS